MRNRIKIGCLICAMFLPCLSIAQDIDIEGQNINIEFENYGACPLYLVPGTSDYNLCRDQERQYRLNRRLIRYVEDIDLNDIEERRNDTRFIVRERYE